MQSEYCIHRHNMLGAWEDEYAVNEGIATLLCAYAW